VQSVVRAALRAIGSPKLTIFADAGCAWEAFGRQHRVIEGLGSTYRVVPVDLGPYRRFHPKAWLLANPDRAVAAIGSGNLTFGGMSANREAWDYGATGGEGADLVAALRAYLPRIVERVPLSESILDDIRAAFSPEFAWTAGLPGPSSIAMSPGDRPLLDQIADNVAGEIRRVSVVTPFFDADGAALVELARRFRAPVTAYVQPSRAGLSRRAAEGLPTGVSVGAAAWKDDEKPSDKQEGKPSKPGNEQKKLARAIHAKVFAFHRDNDAILAVGSANCSRAALTLGSSECNAEMMAVRTVSAADAQEFLGGLELSDVTPTLPEKPHEEEEVVATGSFRIMAARQTVDVVDVAFHCAYSLFAVELETEDGLWWPAARIDAAAASFHSVSRTRVAVLIGTTADGQKLQSLPCWVDDEGSLNAPATLRRLTDRLEGSEVERGSDEYAAVLDLFRDYLRDPESGRGSPRGDRAPPKPLEYDPKTVFADGFADAMKGSGDAGPGAHSGRADAISVIAAFFHMPTHAVAPRDEDPPDDDDPDASEDQVPSKPLRRPKSADTPARLRTAVQNMVVVLTSPTFATIRRPEKIGDDLAFVAAVMASALANGHLILTAYSAATETILQSLFFGQSGAATGAVLARAKALASDEKDAFIADFSSARLSAALMLWISPIVRSESPEGAWFRLCAAQLQDLAPWLFHAAPAEAIYGEIVTLVAKATPNEDPQGVVEDWLRVVRYGNALKCFADALKSKPIAEWLARVTTDWVDAGTILWQSGTFAVATKPCARKTKAKAEVRVLGKVGVTVFMGNFLLPVRELIEECQADLPNGVAETILALVDDFAGITGKHDVAA
jgi:HKD family nuclease